MVFEKMSPSIAHLDFAFFLVDEELQTPFFTANSSRWSTMKTKLFSLYVTLYLKRFIFGKDLFPFCINLVKL